MAEQNFVDYVKICCRSGAGGAGAMHFLRDRRSPKGGPDGGDGGRGGHIILEGNRNVWTLLALKYRKHVIAEPGGNGGESHMSGANGKDIILEVPLGTVARDAESGEIEFEITRHGERRILAPGGRGGLGNSHFKTPTNQAPRYAQPGEAGREEWKILELKVLADVGLVGFPNAGKSTLLSVVTAAKPKIADYPFTTLVPNLGIVPYRDGRSFVMADIPGIIENAHEGKGLGIRFLRHIERNATLLFLVPAEADSISGQYQILLRELELYNPELLDKPRILAISKADLIDAELEEMLRPDIPTDIPHLFISAVTGRGIDTLKDMIWESIAATMAPIDDSLPEEILEDYTLPPHRTQANIRPEVTNDFSPEVGLHKEDEEARQTFPDLSDSEDYRNWAAQQDGNWDDLLND
ncbi:MAG: GTPase ObgE [Lewinellaceae bacterium]|nr:GTPase ObgE [Lewinellaceae bacterium]